MHGGEPAHHSMISDLHVTAQCAVVGKNNLVSDGAIMSDVTVTEKISAIADARFAFAGGAAMRSREFAKCVFVANFQIRRFAVIF